MNKQHTLGERLELVPVRPSGHEGDERLIVNVVYTNLEATAAALKSARDLGHDLGAVIRVRVPMVVPWQLSLQRPPVSVHFMEERLAKMASQFGLEAFDSCIHLYLCRDRLDALARILRPHSLIVIGGRKRWWPTEESRLAKALSSWGNRVLFISREGERLWSAAED